MDLLVAVCIYRLVMISIDLSETTQKSTLEIRDKIYSKINSVQDNIQDKI